MFIFPSVGALTIVEVIGSVLTGAIIGGVAMACVAVLTELVSAIHKMGIPKVKLNMIHRAIEQGSFIVILHCSEEQAERYSIQLRHQGAEPVISIPVVL
ncbi:MAG: hypothetical protein MUR51_00075 [Pseudomonadota bacterium]|nr:hypothetical protein [Pseudomonadota bacterium]